MIDKKWLIDKYNEIVADAGDEGSTKDKSRDEIAHAYADAVENGDIEEWDDDLVEQGRALFDRFIQPEREQRRRSFRKDIGYLVDALNDETILGADDPAFDLAYPIGDGRDKLLGDWNVNDWMSASHARNRNAEEAANAATEFLEQATVFVTQLASHNVHTTRQLFGDAS